MSLFLGEKCIYDLVSLEEGFLSIVAKIGGGGGGGAKGNRSGNNDTNFHCCDFSSRFVSIFLGVLSFRLHSNSRHAFSKTQPVRYARRKLKGNINSSQHRNICSSSE